MYASVKPIIAGSLGSSYPDRAFVEAVGLTIPAKLEAIIREGNEGHIWTAAELVPDEFVERFAWAGTAEQIAAQITILANPPEAVTPTLQAFANEVMPRVQL